MARPTSSCGESTWPMRARSLSMGPMATSPTSRARQGRTVVRQRVLLVEAARRMCTVRSVAAVPATHRTGRGRRLTRAAVQSPPTDLRPPASSYIRNPANVRAHRDGPLTHRATGLPSYRATEPPSHRATEPPNHRTASNELDTPDPHASLDRMVLYYRSNNGFKGWPWLVL